MTDDNDKVERFVEKPKVGSLNLCLNLHVGKACEVDKASRG